MPALVTHMDAAIGRLLKTLDKLKLRDNTLVIFASDNGAAVQAPLKLFNCNAGSEAERTALRRRHPRAVHREPAQPRTRETLNNIIYFPDVMPTFAALAGSEQALPQGYSGINILPLFYGKQTYQDGKPINTRQPTALLGISRQAACGEKRATGNA